MIHWFNFTTGRRFSFLSSALDPQVIDSLVNSGFYYLGEPGQVRCCGCRNRVTISYDTKVTHKLEVPDCFLIKLTLFNDQVLVGVSTAEEELKEVLRNHRAINQLSFRQRTFEANTDLTYAKNGFIRNGNCLECTYCHFLTNDWDAGTLQERHMKDRMNCIFNQNEYLFG